MPRTPRDPDEIPLPVALARGRLFVAGTFNDFDFWAHEHRLTLVVNAWWNDSYQWFHASQVSQKPQASKVSQMLFKVCWVNYNFGEEQQVEPDGAKLSPDERLQVAMRLRVFGV